MDLLIPIENLPKTSSITIRKLKKIGIKTYFDLINYFPLRYENYSLISKINQLQPGEKLTITGKIINLTQQISKKGLKIIIIQLEDSTGKIDLIFYNQPYLLSVFKKGNQYSFAGKVESFNKKISFLPLEYEIGEPKIHTGRIIPIYPEKKGLSSRTIREKIFFVISQYLEKIVDFLPSVIIKYNQIINEKEAYLNIHFPNNQKILDLAQHRLSFDELFLIQLSAKLTKKTWEKERVVNKFLIDNEKFLKIKEFINKLPFKLTNAQIKVWREILADLKKDQPMNRLLQGDVGCGKTIVAALACYLSYLNGYQSLLMAPTEILANQHFETINNLFKNYPIKIGLETGSKKISKKTKLSELDIIIGTHALINKKIRFGKVGLVIIDEQHRFGVEQRARLKEKGINPHLLTITATPIPRTVALTLYGELDLSIIDEMPKGRLPVKTYLISKNKRNQCYQWIKEKIKKEGAQVFIVCPLIEESKIETLKSIKAAKKEFETLKKIFDQFKLGLLHGKMKTKEKDKIINDFLNSKIDILVTTPVVEVGIDIPNATIMIIEAAERFGLAQLHQLRGRIGRRNQQGYCFLFTEKQNQTIIDRLNFFSKTTNGLKLAEKDLITRGPGNLYGYEQHGYFNLKIASFTDFQLIEKTKNAVDYFLKKYKISDFPILNELIVNKTTWVINN